jgi:hypothetical protein
MIGDQAEFRQALLDPTADRPEGLTDGRGNAAGRRFDVYRNNVAVSLTEALESAFPVVFKLLGERNFRILAGVFLRQHPPSSPLMMHYGQEMPDFLAAFEPTAKLGYLPDVARLELAMRESYHAADAAPLASESLESVLPETLMESSVGVAPSLRLIRSRWPIHAIWRFNTETDAPKPAMRPEDVLIMRAELDPEPHLLPSGGGALLAALIQNQTLSVALDAATAEAPGFDLSAVLTLLLAGGAIISIGDAR